MTWKQSPVYINVEELDVRDQTDIDERVVENAIIHNVKNFILNMNKSFVDYVIQDYAKPMGVATYKTSKDMSEELRKALLDIEDLRELLDESEE